MIMLKTLGIAFALFVATTSPAFGGTIDFENVPQDYWYYGGGQNFGNYWSGVTFGPGATILEDQVYGYNSAGYPPHSGHAVLFSLSTPYIRADFDTAVNSVSLWYTSASLFYIDAYDAFGSLIGTAGGAGNYGTNSFLQVTSLTANIAYVIMHDSGNYFTIDDFTSDSTSGLPSSVPERGETLFLLSIGVAALIASRRNLLG